MIERGGVPALEKVILELVEFDRQAQKAVRAAEERSASERARIVQEKDCLLYTSLMRKSCEPVNLPILGKGLIIPLVRRRC